MSDNQQNNTTFQTSSRSRRRVKRQKPWLAIPLALLVLLFAVALFLAVKHAIGKWGGGESNTPPKESETTEVTAVISGEVLTSEALNAESGTDSPVESGGPSESRSVPAESSEQGTETSTTEASPATDVSSATEALPATETSPATSADSTTEGSTPVSGAFHLYTAAELLPLPAEINRGLFEDVNASDDSGSWWFGSMVRNLETGEVVKGYDRSAATLQTLAKYGAIYRKNEGQKVTYLTFDCGYEYGFTASILDTLRDKNVQAVFFVAGDFVNDPKNGDLLRRMYAEGHVIGSHTDHHPVMPKLSDEEFIEEQNNLQIKVNNMLGLELQIRYYRPPQGSSSERDLYLASKMGLTTVFWSYAYGDYDTQNQMEVSKALEKAKVGLHDGCVYLLHAVSSTNAAMLGDLIDYIRGEGYEIRRIDQ